MGVVPGGGPNGGARFYTSSFGRFISPDWSAKVEPVPYAKLDNPQSLNLYAYVGNNPESLFDPDGHHQRIAAVSTEEVRTAECNAFVCSTTTKTVVAQQKAQQQSNSQGQSNQQPSSSSGRVNSPSSGDPDSSVRIPGNGPGRYTDRTYGPDGHAVKDVDYGHDHGQGDPHAHDWDHSGPKPQRGPGRPLTPEEKHQIQNAAKKVGFWGTIGVVTYWVISEGSRIAFPLRNLVPVP